LEIDPMSLDYRNDAGKSPIAQPAADRSSAPGKQTLTSALDASNSPAPGAAGKAERGAGDLRAHSGGLAEGSHPGVRRSGGGKRKIGNIVGGTFVRDPHQAAPAAGAAVAAEPAAGPSAAPTAAKGRDSDRAYVGSASSHVADRTTTDGTTGVHMEDENDTQAAMISAAVTRAREILDNALAQIGSPTAPKVATALQSNFHSTEAKVSTEVQAKLQRIRSAFNGTIPVEVESEGTARAYVYVIWSDIHLCPPWFADPSADGRARTIIHECSHKYTGTDDKAYHWDPKYASLSVKDALDNADSYAWFCIDVL
jgi:hypothetical protein